MKPLRRISATRRLLTPLLCSLITAPACAGPFSDLIVFGDSLSDVGNVLSNPLVDTFFPIDDFDNRFSNGPVYAERLSEGLGLGPLTRSETGGDNFANGGAETDGPGFFGGGSLIDSLVEQVDTYLGRLGSATADPDALHVVFIGANNLLDGRTDTVSPAADVLAQLGRLSGAGARHFLGVNLPKLGLTARFQNDPTLAAARTATTIAFNDALDTTYDTFESANPGALVYRLDVESLFDDLIERADQLGLTNTGDPGQDVSGDSFDRAPGYVFWDDVHPTREVHALLGEAAIRAVLPAGDYDRDGFVTEADYLVWRAEFGNAFDAAAGVTDGIAADGNGDGRVDAADYTLWRDAFAAVPIETLAVPEPNVLALFTAAIAGLVSALRARRFDA